MDKESFSKLEKIQRDLRNVLGVVVLIENDSYNQEPDGVLYGAVCLMHEKLNSINEDVSGLFERIQ